jgi:hypothetical protein
MHLAKVVAGEFAWRLCVANSRNCCGWNNYKTFINSQLGSRTHYINLGKASPYRRVRRDQSSIRRVLRDNESKSLSLDSFKVLVVTRILECILVLRLPTLFMDSANLTGGFFADHFNSHMSLLYIDWAFKSVEWAILFREAKGLRLRSYHRNTPAIMCFEDGRV